MYQGYLFKIGMSELPMKYFKEKTFKAKPNQRQDLNSFRNARGRMTRHVVENMPSKMEIQTIDGLVNDEIEEIMSIIRNNYLNEAERKVSVTMFCQDINDYKTEEMYMVDPEFVVKDYNENRIKYQAFTLKFIGY